MKLTKASLDKNSSTGGAGGFYGGGAPALARLSADTRFAMICE
jgi:hypothetical protein